MPVHRGYKVKKTPRKHAGQVGSVIISKLKNQMSNGIGKINVTNVKGAVVSGLITAAIAGASYVIGVGDIFAIDAKALANVFALALLTSLVSLIKSLLTTNDGKVAGIKVAE